MEVKEGHGDAPAGRQRRRGKVSPAPRKESSLGPGSCGFKGGDPTGKFSSTL